MKLYKQFILMKFNDLRNEVAGGNLEQFPSAARMAKMQWDGELADLAARNVMACQCKYDKCRSTKLFKYAGQSVATFVYTGLASSIPDVDIINERIDYWFSKQTFVSVEQLESFHEVDGNP